jgi:hypothetical protein
MQKQLEATRSLSLADLKELVNIDGPCITMYMPLEAAPNLSQMDQRRMKSLVRRVDEELAAHEMPKAGREELVESLRELSPGAINFAGESGSLAVLRSPYVFRAAPVGQKLDESVVIASHFHLFPILHWLQVSDESFYLLALSQKHVRLLRCTSRDVEEVELPPNTPSSLEEWLNTPSPANHSAQEAPEPGSTVGSFTSTHDREKRDEHLANFFRVINRAVFDKLRDGRAPLILCGVDYERTLYKGVNTYQHLVEDGVQGSPESLKRGDMHARALEIARDFFAAPARKALSSWDKIAGSERAVTEFPQVVKAAFEARVAQLFAADGAKAMGVFDRATMQMKVQGRQEDLVNAAVMQTIAYGGDVFVCKPEDVPGGGQVAAITRF